MPFTFPDLCVMFSPGRGKTVSTVKAIEQLLEHDPNARIVAWTLNDSDAADLITQKLMHLGATDVFCVSSMSRMFGDFTQMLHKFSLNNENQAFVMPTMESVLKYRVVVLSDMRLCWNPSRLGLEARSFRVHLH